MGSLPTHQELRAMVWIPLSITTLICGLRFFVRAKLRNFGAEDYFIGVAWVCYLIAMIAGELSMDLPTDEQRSRAFFASYLAGFLSLCCSKIGIALALLRLWGGVKDWRRLFILGNKALFLGLSVLGLITAVTSTDCRGTNRPPPATYICVPWSRWIEVGFLAAWTIHSAFLDLAYSFLAIFTVYKLRNLQRRKKIGLYAVLGFGCCACPFAILRGFGPYKYFTLATTLEISLVILGASLPTLMPLYEWWRHGRALQPRSAQNRKSTAQNQVNTFERRQPRGDEEIGPQSYGQGGVGHQTGSATRLLSLGSSSGRDHHKDGVS